MRACFPKRLERQACVSEAAESVLFVIFAMQGQGRWLRARDVHLVCIILSSSVSLGSMARNG